MILVTFMSSWPSQGSSERCSCRECSPWTGNIHGRFELKSHRVHSGNSFGTLARALRMRLRRIGTIAEEPWTEDLSTHWPDSRPERRPVATDLIGPERLSSELEPHVRGGTRDAASNPEVDRLSPKLDRTWASDPAITRNPHICRSSTGKSVTEDSGFEQVWSAARMMDGRG